MPRDKFKTVKGRLTHYALACGYIEQFEHAGHCLTLWHEGGPMFQVRQHDHGIDNQKPNGPRIGAGRIFWDSFETLPMARKRFDTAKRSILAIKE